MSNSMPPPNLNDIEEEENKDEKSDSDPFLELGDVAISQATRSEVESAVKRKKGNKKMEKRSVVWQHFKEFKDGNKTRGKCNYCGNTYLCDGHINGTSSLNKHMKKCKKNPEAIKARQSQLSL
ncbi:hypothetical protein M5689_000622 [Euphorbia peplus]|nr:hypothetical protein M5689_000622 [Euphorbia peplus]